LSFITTTISIVPFKTRRNRSGSPVSDSL
jgi:hypothetical protein